MFCGGEGGGVQICEGGPNPLADMDGGANPLIRGVQIRCDTGRIVNHVEIFFTQKPEKSVEGKPYCRNTVKANSFQARQIFFCFPSKKAVFHYSG